MPSTVVAAFSYDPEEQILKVRFVSGLVYEYLEVPERIYEEMKSAFSKGTYLNQQVKGNFDFRKVK